MIQKQARRLQAVFLASDVAATGAALLAAYVVRFETVWPIPLGPQPLANYTGLLPVIAVLWPVVFYFHRLYQLRRDRSSVDEALAVVMASSEILQNETASLGRLLSGSIMATTC